MKKLFLLFGICFLFSSLFAQQNAELNIVPKPNSIQLFKDEFVLSNNTFIVTLDDIPKDDEAFFIYECKKRFGIKPIHGLSYNLEKPSVIRVTIDMSTSKTNGGYSLYVSPKLISITGYGNDGIFNALQSLLQLASKENDSLLTVPCCLIEDAPKFEWRGMHLDVSRHFFTKEEVKKYLDLLAFHKMNVFHWHLTDDQGWRIEIKKYPLLTEVGSKRDQTMVGKDFAAMSGDGKPVGGFYTQQDVQEILGYAANRHITVVPEIEMPGHSQAALAAYPQFSCSEKKGDVLTKWGVSENVFCTKDSTLNFLKDILSEVMDLFPSQYIHIGGDEVPKTAWKACSRCQQRMKNLHLKDENELQSWFIKQIDSFITSKGRNTIGWDEILEGGLAPNAAVMSWRGDEGGIAAAKQKHKVVMCPGAYCYFDHYQSSPLTQPLAIGGYLTVQKVYAFNPIPDSLKGDERKMILGGQGNLWTEYIPDFDKLTFMALPRMSAMAEALWTNEENKNWASFQQRLLHVFKYWETQKINFSKALFDVESKITPIDGGVEVSLQSAFQEGKIKYSTCDSCRFKTYSEPLKLTKSVKLLAFYENKDWNMKSDLWKQKFIIHKATGKKIEFKNQPAEAYNTGGAGTLVDGIKGVTPWYGKEWLGFSGTDCEALIDLGTEKAISKIKIGLLNAEPSWIYLPDSVFITCSLDGEIYIPFFTQHLLQTEDEKKAERQEWTYVPDTHQNEHCLTDAAGTKISAIGFAARYLKIKIKNKGIIPQGKNGAGEKAWLFVDEIEVR